MKITYLLILSSTSHAVCSESSVLSVIYSTVTFNVYLLTQKCEIFVFVPLIFKIISLSESEEYS